MWPGPGGRGREAVTRERASSEGDGWGAGAAGPGVWLCPVGPQAGPACSAGSRLPSHWAFSLLEAEVWEPGDLWREKRREKHRGLPFRHHGPGFLTGGSSNKRFLFCTAIS